MVTAERFFIRFLIKNVKGLDKREVLWYNHFIVIKF